jgi:hypothetical protein
VLRRGLYKQLFPLHLFNTNEGRSDKTMKQDGKQHTK